MKKLLILSLFSVLLVAYSSQPAQEPVTPSPKTIISSFDECVAAGYPVMESYPGRCQVPDGPSFTQDIGNELEFSDEILIESPRPNSTVTSPMTIRGRARGQWFFEAHMSAELLDEHDQPVGTATLQAVGEWMTTEFVPFTGTMTFSLPAQSKATLVIKNANPSGLPENEKILRIPVLIN